MQTLDTKIMNRTFRELPDKIQIRSARQPSVKNKQFQTAKPHTNRFKSIHQSAVGEQVRTQRSPKRTHSYKNSQASNSHNDKIIPNIPMTGFV